MKVIKTLNVKEYQANPFSLFQCWEWMFAVVKALAASRDSIQSHFLVLELLKF